MKVFISWSGELSRAVAELLASWIPDVLQGVECWMSSKDIETGSIWFDEIQSTLQEVGTGILCVTRDNMEAPFLLFEAGALSKGLSKNRVIPLLIDLKPADVRPPLGQFNCVRMTREGLLKVVVAINAQSGEKALPKERIEKIFEKWWGDFDFHLGDLLTRALSQMKPKPRDPQEVLEELLEISRSIQRYVAESRVETERRVQQEFTSRMQEANERLSKQLEDMMEQTRQAMRKTRDKSEQSKSESDSVSRCEPSEG